MALLFRGGTARTLSRPFASLGLAALLVAGLAGPCRAAQSDATPRAAELAVAPDEFRENYSSAAKVSGTVIAGVSLGPVANWSPEAVDIALPSPAPAMVCLRANTLDGRFWSDNPYRPPAARIAGFGPISRRYTSDVSRFERQTMLFRAVATQTDCANLDDGLYLPAVGAPADDLYLYVNSGDRQVAARLLSDSGGVVIAPFWCEDIVANSPVAADKRCIFETQGVSGPMTAELIMQGMTQTERREIRLYVPD